jgi:hypothetical protein
MYKDERNSKCIKNFGEEPFWGTITCKAKKEVGKSF